MDVNVGPRAAF